MTTTSKQQQLRQLNAESRDLQVALNQARDSLDHAARLVEQSYQSKRRAILDEADPDALQWDLKR